MRQAGLLLVCVRPVWLSDSGLSPPGGRACVDGRAGASCARGGTGAVGPAGLPTEEVEAEVLGSRQVSSGVSVGLGG